MADQSNIQTQIQTQQQVQIQTLSPQQVLEARLLALSTIELEEHVRSELNDNPALEDSTSEPLTQDQEPIDPEDSYSNDENEYASADERDDWNDDDDDWYEKDSGSGGQAMDIPLADTRSFYDILYEQLREQDLGPRQMKIALYIIGSIDNDGLLDKDLQAISDDLAFYHNLDASTAEIEQVLKVIQDFDPAGIGARNLQECLLIQIRRKEDSPSKQLQEKIISTMFDEFTHKRWV